MAITNASRLADFGSGIGTEGAVIQVDNTNVRLGIGTTNPQAMLQVGTGVSVYGDSGIVSATTFRGEVIGDVTGNVTGNASGSSGSCTGNSATATVATNAQGLTGNPHINITNITGVAATFTGVLTYEDVINVDSTGIVTARGGVKVGSPTGVGVTIGVDNAGDAIFAGIVTAASFSGPTNVPTGQTGTVTLAASDAGKHVAATGTVTLGTGIFAVGDAVTIWNNSGGNINIVVSAVTCYNAADATTTSPRVLAQRGLATILCVAANTYVISGAGLS